MMMLTKQFSNKYCRIGDAAANSVKLGQISDLQNSSHFLLQFYVLQASFKTHNAPLLLSPTAQPHKTLQSRNYFLVASPRAGNTFTVQLFLRICVSLMCVLMCWRLRGAHHRINRAKRSVIYARKISPIAVFAVWRKFLCFN